MAGLRVATLIRLRRAHIAWPMVVSAGAVVVWDQMGDSAPQPAGVSHRRVIETNPLKTYPAHVARLRQAIAGDAALEVAVGGDFITVGELEFSLLKQLGLQGDHLVADIGCGSGRLARPLSVLPNLRYLGTDIVQDLLDHAARITGRGDWSFVRTNGLEIPLADGQADWVCFFSVFTHLTHEDTFRYLKEAKRVLKPGGKIVFSFLEFRVYAHWSVFQQSVENGVIGDHLNQFMSRDAIESFAHHLRLKVEGIYGGDTDHIPIEEDLTWHDGRVMSRHGSLGQSVAVLTR
jgi:SAM-dependent methyltransferase